MFWTEFVTNSVCSLVLSPKSPTVPQKKPYVSAKELLIVHRSPNVLSVSVSIPASVPLPFCYLSLSLSLSLPLSLSLSLFLSPSPSPSSPDMFRISISFQSVSVAFLCALFCFVIWNTFLFFHSPAIFCFLCALFYSLIFVSGSRAQLILWMWATSLYAFLFSCTFLFFFFVHFSILLGAVAHKLSSNFELQKFQPHTNDTDDTRSC